MAGEAAVSLAWFAFVWALLCLVAGTLVMDAMLRSSSAVPSAEQPDAVPPRESPTSA